MDIIGWMNILGAVVTAFIIYRLMVYEKKDRTKGHYTRPAWNFFFKKIYAEYRVRNQQKHDQHKILRELKRYECEAPKILPSEESSDSQLVYGSDDKGNSLLIKLTRRRHRVAEVWMIFKATTGETYCLPEHPNTQVVNATPRIFEGAGLKLECLTPYAKWRITYSGMLRRGIALSVSDDDSDLQYVRMNFIWTTGSDPLFWPFSWSPKLIATALATEKWRDGKWMQMILKKDSGGYDQFGACRGEICFYEKDLTCYVDGLLPNQTKIELNLPGIRQRRWGPHKTHHLHRTGVLMGTIEDGCAFEVGAFSAKYGLTHSQFGNVRFPNGTVHAIDWTDFNLASLGEHQNQLPEATIVQMKAGNREMVAVIRFRRSAKIALYGGSQNENWNAFIVPIEIKLNVEKGYGFAIFWYPKNIQEFDIQEIPTTIKRIFNRTDRPETEKPLVSFADKEAQSVLVAGGKGSSLAILQVIRDSKGADFLDKRNRSEQILNALVDQASSNPLKRSLRVQNILDDKDLARKERERSGSLAKIIFPDPHDFDVSDYDVPQGFIVSVSAMKNHLSENPEIVRTLNELEDVVYERQPGDIKDMCQRVQSSFHASELCHDLKEKLAKKLEAINSDKNARFAVRSSGVTEDSEETSTAGQNETFLGLKTDNDVSEAIVKCWASLFSFHSVQYRKQHIQPILTEMAVVVQKMVDAQAAGVMFTRHPISGDPSVIMITANYGLGESVVSARADPDTFLVKKSYKDNLEILGSKAGEKKLLITMDENKSVKEVELEGEARSKLCLSAETVEKLAKLGVIMEKFFGTPRDIEFAVTKDMKIYLLQSRPVTSLNNFTDFEMIHEHDASLMSPSDIFTRANVGEVLLGPISQITQSTVTMVLEKSVTQNFFGKEHEFSGLYSRFFPVIEQHLFMDIGMLFLTSLKKEVDLFLRVSSLGVFGSDIFEKYPEIITIGLHRNEYNKPNSWKMLKSMYAGLFGTQARVDEMKEICEKIEAQFSDQAIRRLKVSSDVLDLISRGLEDLRIVGSNHMIASNSSVLYQIIAFGILIQKSKQLTTTHKADIAVILGSISDVESANVPEMIKEIAGKIVLAGKREDFLEIASSEAVKWLEDYCPDVFASYTAFMKRHGHRSINELDIIAKPWSLDQETIIEMIKSNLKISGSETSHSSSFKALTADDILDKIKTPLGPIAKFLMRKILPRCQKGVQNREIAKSRLVFAVNEIRRAVSYLGKLMVNEGLLPEKELIFHLTLREIRVIIDCRDSRIVSRAIRRQKIFPKLKELKFPEISFGPPKTIKFKHDDYESATVGDVLVRGTPVCGGVVLADACVCRSFADVDKIKKGDILITYGTDIAWSPYFPILSGVVTEIGGLISHGAVVAREYGLPCIVAATGATDIVKHGQKIRLDANNGTITLTEA